MKMAFKIAFKKTFFNIYVPSILSTLFLLYKKNISSYTLLEVNFYADGRKNTIMV